MENKVSILIPCHKSVKTIANKVVQPVQSGANFAPMRFENMIYDDLGENISVKNKRYCELTAIYYGWKNIEADYYGFFNYRKYLSLSGKHFFSLPFRTPSIKEIDGETENYLGLTEDNIIKFVSDYDLILPERVVVGNNYLKYKNSKGHYIKDLDFCLDVIESDYAEIYPSAKKYMRSGLAYQDNMFIMKKQFFIDYCSFTFDILKKHEDKFDCCEYDNYAYRVGSFLGERLLGIYVTYLIDKIKVRYKRVQSVNIKNPEII